MGAEAVVLAFRVDDREGFQGRVSSRNGGLVLSSMAAAIGVEIGLDILRRLGWWPLGPGVR